MAGRHLLLLVAATLPLGACGRPPDPPSVDNSADAMAANIEAMARNMEAMASADGNGATDALLINDADVAANSAPPAAPGNSL